MKLLEIFADLQIGFGVLGMFSGLLVGALACGIIAANVDTPALQFITGTWGAAVAVALVMGGLSMAAYGEVLLLIKKIEENTRK